MCKSTVDTSTMECKCNEGVSPAAFAGYSFDSVAVKLRDGEIGAWTDGVGVYCDTEPFCAFKLKAGKKYRVTIQEL